VWWLLPRCDVAVRKIMNSRTAASVAVHVLRVNGNNSPSEDQPESGSFMKSIFLLRDEKECFWFTA
jgi:hypothetical protein